MNCFINDRYKDIGCMIIDALLFYCHALNNSNILIDLYQRSIAFFLSLYEIYVKYKL